MTTKNAIDANKLRELGVPEEVVESLDPRDGGNIAPDGRVLFLDGERQRRKEDPDRPMRRNSTSGARDTLAGIASRAYAKHIVTGKTLALAVDLAARKEGDPISTAVYELLGFGENGYTHINVLPLHIDLSDANTSTIVPIDFMMQEIDECDYVAIMHECVCRKTRKCKHHPHDLGCIFMGPVGRAAVRNGLADVATKEEAKRHVLRAAEEGLMGATEFVEGEQLFWGVKNKDMHEYRMFCFCCDCCCFALQVLKHGSWDTSRRFTSVGWTATVNHDTCIGCHKCEPRCPQHCITYREDRKAVIDQELCLGCGFCKIDCPSGALSIVQTMPAREKLNDYYLAENRVDDLRKHSPARHYEGINPVS